MRLPKREDYHSDKDYTASLERSLGLLHAINADLGKLVDRSGWWAERYSDGKRIFGDPSYPYIPYDRSLFIEALYYVASKFRKPTTFCDVGCGIGDKVLLAHNHGFQSCGIEHNPYLIRHAKRLFGISSDTMPAIIQKDVMQARYNRYRVVYMYSPFQSKAHEDALERRIFSQLSLGAYLMLPQQSLPCPKSFNFLAEVGGIRIYRKVKQGNRILHAAKRR